MRHLLGMAVGLLLWTTAPVSAQVLGTGIMPVMEIGTNLYQNTITATEAIMQTFNMGLELTPVEQVVVAQGMADDLAQLAALVEDAQGLSYDLASLNAQIVALFDLTTAPDTRPALEARVVAIQQTQYQVRVYALRVQTLIRTALHTVEHMMSLLQGIGAFVGQMQANQHMVQVQATLSHTLVKTEVQQAAWGRSEVSDKMADALITESINRINKRRLEGWPTW